MQEMLLHGPRVVTAVGEFVARGVAPSHVKNALTRNAQRRHWSRLVGAEHSHSRTLDARAECPWLRATLPPEDTEGGQLTPEKQICPASLFVARWRELAHKTAGCRGGLKG